MDSLLLPYDRVKGFMYLEDIQKGAADKAAEWITNYV